MFLAPILILAGFLITLTGNTFLAFTLIIIGAVLSVIYTIREW